MSILLGQRVKDKVTGFTGTVTGIVQYLTGCNQMLIHPGCRHDGTMMDSHWLDEQRLEVLDHSPIQLGSVANLPGPDMEAPKW